MLDLVSFKSVYFKTCSFQRSLYGKFSTEMFQFEKMKIGIMVIFVPIKMMFRFFSVSYSPIENVVK